MIEASEASPVQHIRRARCLDDPLLQNARRLAVKAITNNSWSKRHSLKLEIEPNFVRLGLLLAGFSNQPTRITGIGGCESKQVSQRGRREGVDTVMLREPKRQRRRLIVLFRETTRIGINIRAVLAHLRQGQGAYPRMHPRLNRSTSWDHPAKAIVDVGVVAKDRDSIGGQVHVGFDRGDAQVESNLESRQGVFRLETPSAAMTLKFETRKLTGC